MAPLGNKMTSGELSEVLGDTNLLSAAVFLGHSSLQGGKLAASNLWYIFSNYGTSRKLPCRAAKNRLQSSSCH